MIWLSDESAVAEYFQLLNNPNIAQLAEKLCGMDRDEEEENPVAMTKANGIGILNISGTTISAHNWMTKFFGLISYEDIRNAVVEAADDSEVKAILLNINSGGGQANGVGSLSRFISSVNKNVKPVYGFTGASMHSAAMWYGSAGESVFADEDASLGSVGAIMVHTEYSEMLKRQGINATVFRSAKYKALGQPVEALSDDAKEEFKESLSRLHNKFVNGLSSNLSLSPSHVATKIADGKTYDAEQANALGLVSKVLSFDQLIAKLGSAIAQ